MTWALSAGLGAAVLHLVSCLIAAGQVDEAFAYLQRSPNSVIIGVTVCSMAALAFFFPLWISAAAYLYLFPRRSRASAMLWCSCFHAAVHLTVGVVFNVTLAAASYNLHVPLIIGAIWGAWLPGTVDSAIEHRR